MFRRLLTVVLIRLLASSNAVVLAWMLRSLIFRPIAVVLVLAAWVGRRRLPLAWLVIRRFYGVM